MRRGHSTIGRAVGVDVVLADALVSKRHARVEVDQGIELVDLNSANGLIVDGGLVQRVRVMPGQVITIGDDRGSNSRSSPAPTTRSIRCSSAAARSCSTGRLASKCATRASSTAHPVIPTEADPRLFPWPMIVAPMMLGLAMFFVTGNPYSLSIVAMSPLMMLGNFVGQRTQQGKKLRLEIDTFEEQIEELEETLARETAVERARRHAEAPAVATVYEQAMRLGPMLWTRRPEHWNFLALRLGVGRARSRNTVQQSNEQRGIARYARQVDTLRTRHEFIDDVPLIEMLPHSGAIGIAGPRHLAADVLRGLGVQLFGLHAPNEVITAAIVDPAWARELEWMKWLPHTTSPRSPFAELALADSQSAGTALLNGLEETILGRLSGTPSRRGPLPETDTTMALGARVGEAVDRGGALDGDLALVLIASNDAPVDRPRLTQVIERGADAGIFTIFLAPTVESLPAACRTYIDATEGLDRAKVGLVRAGEQFETVGIEGVSNQYAEVFAKRLAPVADSSSVAADSSDLPRSVSLLKLIGTDIAAQPATAIERWRQNNSILDRSRGPRPRLKRAGTLKAFIGQGSPDAMSLDLRTQGPHALVGGTTGSGKSEFLQAWVLGMAAEYSPDRVTFLFVDYKGGSAFADCVELPHCVGLVTDLSPHLVRRALTSLRAELHHREHLFNRKKAKDLLELEKRQDPETPPAARAGHRRVRGARGRGSRVRRRRRRHRAARPLARHPPDHGDAAAGRCHQGQPACQHEPARRAAHGRRLGFERRRRRPGGRAPSTLRSPAAGSRRPGPDASCRSSPATRAAGRAMRRMSRRCASPSSGSVRRWCGSPTRSDDGDTHDARPRSERPETHGREPRRGGVGPRASPPLDGRGSTTSTSTVDLRRLPLDGDGKIPLGVADIPERQAQVPMFFEPDTDGHLLVYGTSGAGKSAALRTIATAAGARPDLGGVEVYGLDFGTGSLRSIEALPHVGSIVPGDDAERIQRLLRTVRGMLDDRAKRFSAVERRQPHRVPRAHRSLARTPRAVAHRRVRHVQAGVGGHLGEVAVLQHLHARARRGPPARHPRHRERRPLRGGADRGECEREPPHRAADVRRGRVLDPRRAEGRAERAQRSGARDRRRLRDAARGHGRHCERRPADRARSRPSPRSSAPGARPRSARSARSRPSSGPTSSRRRSAASR